MPLFEYSFDFTQLHNIQGTVAADNAAEAHAWVLDHWKALVDSVEDEAMGEEHLLTDSIIIDEHAGLIENEVNWDMIERVPSEEDDAYPEDETPDLQQLEQDIRDIAEAVGIDLGPFHLEGSAIILDTPQTKEDA